MCAYGSHSSCNLHLHPVCGSDSDAIARHMQQLADRVVASVQARRREERLLQHVWHSESSHHNQGDLGNSDAHTEPPQIAVTGSEAQFKQAL